MDFDILRATLLALIQGITEFLPISSSAHLIIPGAILEWEDQGLPFDVAVHLGSLVAVVAYFRRELGRLAIAWLRNVALRENSADGRLAWGIILATLPVVVVGLFLSDFVQQELRTVRAIAITTVGFGVLLLVADHRSQCVRSLRNIGWRTCLVIGLAQVLALVPGTSRSGITMTAALLCHMDRESASRFSFLLSVPVIAGASLLMLLDLLGQGGVNWLQMGYALGLSALVSFLCIHYFLKTISALGFLPFVIYRLALGVILFLFFIPL